MTPMWIGSSANPEMKRVFQKDTNYRGVSVDHLEVVQSSKLMANIALMVSVGLTRLA